MEVQTPTQGLISGLSVAEVAAGADSGAFRSLLRDPGALALFDYWCRLIREHGIALKARFDPTEVPGALANIYMEEYDVERRQSRMRLMGEALKSQWEGSVVGLCTDDYVSGSVNELWKRSDSVVYFEKRAALLTYSLEYIDRPHCILTDLALPMEDEAGNNFSIGYAWQVT